MRSKKVLSIFLVIQAILFLSLILTEGIVNKSIIFGIGMVNTIVLISLLIRKWDYAEFFTVSTFIVSTIFIIAYWFEKILMKDTISILIAILLIVNAILNYIQYNKFKEVITITSKKPIIEVYEKEEDHHKESEKIKEKYHDLKSSKEHHKPNIEEIERQALDLERIDEQIRDFQEAMKKLDSKKDHYKEIKKLPEIQLEKTSETKQSPTTQKEEFRTPARLVAEELEREALALKNAERKIAEIKNKEKISELEKESKELSKIQSQIDQARMSKMNSEISKQVSQLEKVQKEIDKLKVTKPKTSRPITKISKTFIVATPSGSRFHETGCMSIKNVKKNKLILFSSKNDAIKKGYKPCEVCIP